MNRVGQTSLLIVGLGEVGQTHLAALEHTRTAQVVAGVDPAAAAAQFRGRNLPVYRTIQEAAGDHDPDVVIIATPTPSHAEMCGQVATVFARAGLLVEKPAADSLDDARYVLADLGATRPVNVAYHMSFSPEVTWAVEMVENSSGLGVPSTIQSWFTDPYSDQVQTARSRFGDSWIDSGINALSVISRFVETLERTSFRQIGAEEESSFEAHLECRDYQAGSPVEVLVVTSWHVSDPAKNTRIKYTSGAELIMDHTAVAGYLIREDTVSAIFSCDRSVPRRDRHYRAMYHHWLVENRPLISAARSLKLHELLV